MWRARLGPHRDANGQQLMAEQRTTMGCEEQVGSISTPLIDLSDAGIEFGGFQPAAARLRRSHTL
jgi:hypothetical protein